MADGADSGPHSEEADAARLEAALARIARARAGGAAHAGSGHAGSGNDTAELKARLDTLIAELRAVLGRDPPEG